MILNERGIQSTVVLFGGARIPEPSKKSEARTEDAGGPVALL